MVARFPWFLQGLLIIALSGGVFLRFAALERKLYWFDETFTGLRVSGYDEHDEVQPRLYTGKLVSSDDIQVFQRPSPAKSTLDTVWCLARKEPQWAPAYFVLARWATELLGPTIFSTRLLSAIFGTAVLMGAYWFAWELFADRIAAAIAASLIGVSPIFVRYSHEARPYAMWLLFSVLSAAALLRALRRQDSRSWAVYSLLLTAALYTNLLTLLQIASFGIYMLITAEQKRDARVPFSIASAASLVVFLPWLAVLLFKRHVAMTIMSHVAIPVPFGFLLTRLSLDFSHLFLQGPPEYDALLAFLALPAVALVGCAFYRLVRDHPPRIHALPVFLAALPIAVTLLPDLVGGGSRSIHPRYLLPAFLTIELTVAFLLARKSRLSGPQGGFWRGVLCFVLIGGLLSSAVSVYAATWEDLGEVDLDMVRLFNEAPGTLVVTDLAYGVLAPLSYRLHKDVRFVLTLDPANLEIPPGFRTVYVYQPSPELKQRIEDRYGVALPLVYQKAREKRTAYSLYKFVPPVK